MTSHRTAAIGRSARHILFSVSTIALGAFATEAQAQQAGDNSVEAVVVTGSRLVTNGAQAPTPVTVVSSEQLQVAAPRNIVDGILQLPAFKGSVSVANQSTGTTSSNGADYLNLRGLGTARTLVLLDGRRVVPARLLEEGFRFKYPDWRGAAFDLCQQWKNAPSKARAA